MKLLLIATTVTLSLIHINPTQAKPFIEVTPFTNTDLRFCGEKLPTHLPAVAERWQKAIVNRARYTEDLLEIQRKAAVLFPIIEPILAENAIPKDLKYLALVESELKSNALSRRGAAGLWQLMPQTARDLGLTVHGRQDQRYDVRKATQAACRYLWDLYKQTGSWMLAASAYNSGPNQISQLARQFSGSHPMMLPFAKAETQAYVYQALAYKELLTNPEQYSGLLSKHTISALARNADVASSAEQQSILAVIETPQQAFKSEKAPDEMPSAMLAQAAIVVSDGTMSESLRFNDMRPAVLPEAKATSAPQLASNLWPSVRTRSLTSNALTEGQLVIFEVTSPQLIDEVAMSVGDVVYAHVEIIDKSSGRVYLRADRIMSSQTRETRPIKLVAVEKDHKPGVPMPYSDSLASGWQLGWEKI